MKALVCLANGFEETEALCTIDVMRRAGIEVTVAGVGSPVALSSHRVSINCDVVLSEELADETWDCVYLPGGMPGATNLASSPLVKKAVLKTYGEGRLVSAICASPAAVFGPWGILEGRKATCYPGCEEFHPGFSFSTEGVVRDGNVITGKSAGWAFDTGLEIVGYLLGAEKAVRIRASIYYKD